jgi:DNA-binding transcriptional ArsR family regulator
MVEDLQDLDAVFRALAHEARRSMLRRLADRDLTVGELAKPLEMSLAAAAKHIQVLVHARLVQQDIVGRNRVCRIQPAHLATAAQWLNFYERYWTTSLDSLSDLLASDRPDPSAAATETEATP